MGHEIKIDVELGGTVTQGQPFKWKNKGPNKVNASGLAGVCPDASYEVPAHGNGKGGEKDASGAGHRDHRGPYISNGTHWKYSHAEGQQLNANWELLADMSQTKRIPAGPRCRWAPE